MQKASSWVHMVGASVRGAAHARADLPNQDAYTWAPSSEGGGGVVAAVSDGHGSKKSFRSKQGAKYAVDVTRTLLLSQLNDLAGMPVERGTQLLQQLARPIVEKWTAEVLLDLREHPFEPDELASLSAGDQREVHNNPLLGYGATLLATVITQAGTYYLQLGDGDIVAVARDGTAWFPLPADDRLAGNETTSLCLPQAWNTVRVSGDYLRQAPRLIMLSTDGYANSFQSDQAFLQVGADLIPMIEQRGIKAIEESLEDWLQQTTEGGAGDDVTLVIASLSLPAGDGRTTAPAPVASPAPKHSAVRQSSIRRPPTKPPTTPIPDRHSRESFAEGGQPSRPQNEVSSGHPWNKSQNARSEPSRGAPPSPPSGRGVSSEPTDSRPARNAAIVVAAAAAIVIAVLAAFALFDDPTPPQAEQPTAAGSEEATPDPPRSSGYQPEDSGQAVTRLQAEGRTWLLLNGQLFVGNGNNPATYYRCLAATPGAGWATMTLEGTTIHLRGPNGVRQIDNVSDCDLRPASQLGRRN